MFGLSSWIFFVSECRDFYSPQANRNRFLNHAPGIVVSFDRPRVLRRKKKILQVTNTDIQEIIN